MNPNQQCIRHLEAGGLVLTRDRRQARLLRRLHDQALLAAGREVWPTAQVQPLETWLAREWQEAAAGAGLPEVLDAEAAGWLWRALQPEGDTGLIDRTELAQSARASWLRLRAHRGSAALLAGRALTHDQAVFRDWALAVEAAMQARGLCDVGDLANQWSMWRLQLPATVNLLIAGMREASPAQRHFLAVLEEQGQGVAWLPGGGDEARSWRYAAADPEDELAAALAWLRQSLEAQPSGNFGLILPDLPGRRHAIERACAAILQPSRELPGAVRGACVYQLAGGASLANWPVVSVALAMFSLCAWRFAYSELSELLRSPYWGDADARAAGTQLDLRWRRQRIPAQWRREDLAWRLRQPEAGILHACLAAADASIEGESRRPPSDWALAFGRVLAAWRWPGKTGLGSEAYQAAEALRERIQALGRLDGVAGRLSLPEILAELRRALAAPFQPDLGEPSIHVLDTLDLPAPWLDGLWVSGQTAANWPRPVRTDPFLPLELQRELGIPGADPRGAVAEARAILAAWRTGTAQLVLSWPRRDNDADVLGTTLLPADAAELPPPPRTPSREARWLAAAALEPVDDDWVPRQGAGARGGARILELQSNCPFRAFAELRLGARVLDEPLPGIDPMTRGSIAHRALQLFWEGLAGSAALAALSPAEVAARIAACVGQALDDSLPAGLGPRSRQLELDWQCQALAGLVALDAGRPAFEVVGLEQAVAAELDGLPLRLKVDRVDRVDGRAVIIDYKTGNPRRSQWSGLRPEAPQLPLYAVLYPEAVTGIAFASVAPGAARYQGVGASDGLLPGMQAAGKFLLSAEAGRGHEWDEVTGHWRATLAGLARDFLAGRAEVDPRRGETCRYCHLGALCRISDAAELEGVEEGDDD